MPHCPPPFHRLRRLALCGGVAVLWLCPWLVRGADVRTKEQQYALIANYLRCFAGTNYVQWPTNTFATTNQAWRIGVVGPDPFGDILEQALQNRKPGQRSVEVWHAATLKDLPPCEIVFVTLKDPDEIKATLEELKTRPVLTVGERPGFLELGGIIELRPKSTMQMDVSLDRARAVNLTISSDVILLTTEVLVNGRRKSVPH